MWVTYHGPHAAVDVPSAGLVDVERGKAVEVPEATGEGLIQQVDNWKKATAPKAANTQAGDGGKAGK